MVTTKIELRSDSVTISGYVNAVGRESRPISSPTGKFVEQVEPGAFKTALTRATNVDLLLNHKTEKKLGSTATGELKLEEDNIGLRAEAVVCDAETIEKARKGELRGWSFGMYVNKAEIEQRAEKVPKRHLQDIDIFEVSIIDTSCLPVYAGTSVECRSESDVMAETRFNDDEVETVNKIPPDLSEYEKRAYAVALKPYESRLAELRYNPYHDPTNGRFTGASGSGGAVLHVGKGEKGKGVYVVDGVMFNSTQKTLTSENTNDIINSIQTSEVIKRLHQSGIEYRKAEKLSEQLDTNEIIQRVGGGDETKGSCSSLAFAYIGNKGGFDVLDYRDGESRSFFASNSTIIEIAKLSGVKSTFVKEYNDYKAVKSLLGNVENGKEYYLQTGRHASIIRKSQTGFEYLELQSKTDNGFKPLTDKVLKKRFKCQKSHTSLKFKYEVTNTLIECESLGKNSDFEEILGYINTSKDKQKKGNKGYVK